MSRRMTSCGTRQLSSPERALLRIVRSPLMGLGYLFSLRHMMVVAVLVVLQDMRAGIYP